jgi:hypothetical protein
MNSEITSIERFVSGLTVANCNKYRFAERVAVNSNGRNPVFIYKWEESKAGADPDSWSEEYYRITVPIASIRPLIEEAIKKSACEGLVPADFWSNVVSVNTYTGDGGESKVEPAFDETYWDHELVLVRLKFTSASVSADFRQQWINPTTNW